MFGSQSLSLPTSSCSHYEQIQAITVPKTGKTMDNKFEENNEEQAGPPKKPTLAKDK